MKFYTVRIVDENNRQSEVQKNRLNVTNCNDQDVWNEKPAFIPPINSGVYTIQLTRRAWNAPRRFNQQKMRGVKICVNWKVDEFFFIWITADSEPNG